MEDNIQGIKRTVCEVWSRVVGYFRPVQNWNEGKQEEYKDRKTFKCSCEDKK
jgi:anaerobic ribonucleoside-triphosphate reductase